jgi:two-component system, cell cycle sensor histidine kinase and response regulator CckA
MTRSGQASPVLESYKAVPAPRTVPLALVAEDDAATRMMAAVSLERTGFLVAQAEDGHAALSAFDRLHPDIVLLDVLMPKMDGIDLCAAIRRRPNGDRTPVLVMTVLDDIDSINRAYEAGATDFIIKPVNWTILGHRARYMLRSSRAEGAVRDGESRYRDLFDRVPVGLFRADPTLRLIDVNLPLVKMGGFPDRESCLATDIRGLFVDPGDPGKILARMEDRKVVRRYEVRMHAQDGGSRWVEINARAVTGADGGILYYEGSLQDIEDRRLAEEALRETTQTLQTIIEASPLAIVVLDPAGRVTLWNPAAERMFGWSEEEAVGRPNPIVPEENREESRRLRERVLGGETITGADIRRRKKDGSSIDINVFAAPLRDETGFIRGIMSVIEDVTERRQAEEERRSLEEQLRHAQRLEAVGRLAGGIAHDFNNFLTVIEGYCGLLLLRMSDAAPERKEVDGIRKAGDRAAALVRQLLAFGRRQVLQPKALCLNHVVSGMVPMLRRLIGEDIEILTALDPGIWTVKADPGQIEQVLMNLAVNARDAMPGAGTLILETANIRLDSARACGRFTVRAGSYAMLAVSDTGCGMDEETQSHLFEPFFTTKESGKGTGLGLATAYGIVKQSGGYIIAYSEPGRGATFKIYLPRSADEGNEAEPAAEETAMSLPARGTETVLVVEDEDAVRDLVCEILSRRGYAVVTACDGDAALRLSERHSGTIHLLVTDVVMPRMSGPELAGRLLAQRREMKVLYTSGYTDNALVRRDILGRGVHFLHKPFSSDLLARRVREALDAP